MVKKIQILIPVIISSIIIGILGIVFVPVDKTKNLDFSKGTIKLRDKLITVDVADSQLERQRWLTFQNEKLSLNTGLLMVYDKPDLYSIWLLNIRYPLDLIWLDEAGDIVYIKKNVPPCDNVLDASKCTYKNTIPAKFVLATTAGFIQYNNITENSKFEIISI